VRGSLRTVVVLGIVGALILVFARNGTGDLGERDFLSLVYGLGFLVLVSGAVLRLFSTRFGQAIQAVLLWAAAAVVLVGVYAYRFELKDASDRVLSELVPGRATARGATVEIAGSGSGEFRIATEVNGAPVSMVLDSGASEVILTRDAAIAAGLPEEMIRYTVNIETANGRSQAAAVTLDRIVIGGIVERSVPALIAQPGHLRTSLLGMSFLSRLKSWEVRGDRLVLRGTADDKAEDR
jgi:aspartyl protease family protein